VVGKYQRNTEIQNKYIHKKFKITEKEYQKYSKKQNKYIHKKYQRTRESNKPPKPLKAITKKGKEKYN
jgi:uncharacterized HAD superfamily protein